MYLRVTKLNEKKLVGNRIEMSFTQNKTYELWSGFMPRRLEINNAVGSELYSAEVYKAHYFEHFNPEATFEKWALVAVEDLEHIPVGMQTLIFPAGDYAVFLHKGPAKNAAETYRYIFQDWFPKSGFKIAERPHFAVMGEKYDRDSGASEEEIWIPVTK